MAWFAAANGGQILVHEELTSAAHSPDHPLAQRGFGVSLLLGEELAGAP
jgi:hypothetical protein